MQRNFKKLKTSFTRNKNEIKLLFISKKSLENETKRKKKEGQDLRKRQRKMELFLMKSI